MNVLVAGDYCPVERIADLVNKGDYNAVFSEVQSTIQESDYSIVNLECPVSCEDNKPIEKLGPNLCCSGKGVMALKWAGFKCVTLANNHFLDYGPTGVKSTIATLDACEIDYVGGGLNINGAASTLYKHIGEEILAIINCCEHEFSIATDISAGSNPLNPIHQFYAIQKARQNADYVLVIVHGGHEHFQLPSPRMVETYRFFIDAGADAVVNHHQHCYSGYEIWHKKPIFYGLGNFCFDDKHYRDGNWTEGYFVTLEFSKGRHSFILHPYQQCAKEPKIIKLPHNAYESQLEILNNTIKDAKSLKSSIEKYYNDSAKYYGNIFEPFYNRLFLSAKYHGFLPSFINKKRFLAANDFVACESHREKLIWWFNHKRFLK